MLWTTSSFNYFMINFYLKYVSPNIFLTSILASAGEIVGYLISLFTYMKWGLKPSLYISLSIPFSGGMLLIFMPNDSSYIAFFVLLARLGISATQNIAFIASTSLFPTIFASTAFGAVNIFARALTIPAPIIAETQKPIPMILFSVLTALCALSQT